MTPAAAHSLWARWLARKPLMHVEADAADLAALQASPEEGDEPPPKALVDAHPLADAQSPAETPAPRSSSAPPADEPQAADDDADGPKHRPGAEASDAPPTTHADAAGAEPPRHAGAAAPEPEVLEPVTESVSDAQARRAAHWAFHGPRVEVVDVIEVPSLQPRERVSSGAVAAQYAIALALAVAAAVCVGVGSTLFGPWGGVLAAAGWTGWVWVRTGRAHRAGAVLPSVLGAHLVLPLLALTVWQFQVAAGLWPAVAPMDLFADVPLGGAMPDEAQRLDWRWFFLAFCPLLAALFWLVRLRRPALLGAVTLLLWAVAFQAVAGVLGALGLAFHGMSTFMLLLGALTVAAGLYIDLKSRAADLPDYARWPYLCGAVLMGAGWVSMAALPMPVPLLRYAGWVVFSALSVALARPSLLAIALAIAGFDLAWALRQSFGSDALGLGVWVLWLVATAGLVAALASYLPAAARPLRFWMPVAWRRYFEPAPTG